MTVFLKSELVTASMGTNSYNYFYDNIGNRQSATNNGKTTTYTPNSLNQYTSIMDGGLKTLSYDLDGNLTNNSVFTYTWDCENRLIGVSSNSSEIASYKYDYMGRRYEKVVNGITNRFLYDGWAMIQEQNLAGVKAYVYGLDLSGTLQGAGTIGGILMANLNETNALFCFDANGNVTDLVGADGNIAGHYEFDPYGKVIVQSGAIAEINPCRFSTKYTDNETEFLYYGYRYYHPNDGRWINRDPLEEVGFITIQTAWMPVDLDELFFNATLPLMLQLVDNLRHLEVKTDILESAKEMMSMVCQNSKNSWFGMNNIDDGGLYRFLLNDGVNYIDVLGLEESEECSKWDQAKESLKKMASKLAGKATSIAKRAAGRTKPTATRAGRAAKAAGSVGGVAVDLVSNPESLTGGYAIKARVDQVDAAIKEDWDKAEKTGQKAETLGGACDPCKGKK